MPRDPTETSALRNRPRGVFITGNDTGTGKTFVGCNIAKLLIDRGVRLGVYKPVASGCERRGGELVSDDALALWHAAGTPKLLHDVCPQRFAAPLAPNLAARAEDKAVDAALLRAGARCWLAEYEFTIIEGAGGYFSPISDADLNADLAIELGLPVLLVVANRLGAINQALTAVHAIRTYRGGLPIAGVLLNDVEAGVENARDSNLSELMRLLPETPCSRVEHGSVAASASVLQWLGVSTSVTS